VGPLFVQKVYIEVKDLEICEKTIKAMSQKHRDKTKLELIVPEETKPMLMMVERLRECKITIGEVCIRSSLEFRSVDIERIGYITCKLGLYSWRPPHTTSLFRDDSSQIEWLPVINPPILTHLSISNVKVFPKFSDFKLKSL
jgi:hypothetical protein